MGHIRLGRLPATKRWQQVVALLAQGAPPEKVAEASAQAAEYSLEHARGDPALLQSFWFLTQIPLAARSVDYDGSLRRLGLSVGSRPSLVEIVSEPEERRDMWLRALAAQYGANALSPRAHLETDWAAEEWSLGGMIAHFAPGVLTNFGHVIREPAGRIHWAGSERATEMHGLIEGAVRSVERAADEVVAFAA